MKVYRGTRDIFPHQINHKKISQGVYGDASYYALHKSDAQMYSMGGAGSCSVVATYEIQLKNLLEINSLDYDIKNISDATNPKLLNSSLQEKLDYQNTYLPPVALAKVAMQSGFEMIWLKDMVEGGEQILVPETVSFEISLISMDVKLRVSNLGTTKDNLHQQEFLDILNSKGIVVEEQEYFWNFTLTPQQLDSISEYLNFIQETIRGKSFYAIKFNTLTVQSYDDED